MTDTTIMLVKSGAIELYSEAVGLPQNPPVLLIMGANASSRGWPSEFIESLLAANLRVITYDHRDTGRSTTRPFDDAPYAVSDLADDAVAVLDAHGIDAAHIVGLSLGGSIAQLIAIDYADRVQSLSLMMTAGLDVDFVGNIRRAMAGEPSIDGLPTPKGEIIASWSQRAAPSADLETELARRVAEWLALSGTPTYFRADEFARWEALAIEHAGSRAQPGTHGLAAPIPIEKGRELDQIRVPVLVIQGLEDPVNPHPHGRHLASLIKEAIIAEIPGLGHSLPSHFHGLLSQAIALHVHRAGAKRG